MVFDKVVGRLRIGWRNGVIQTATGGAARVGPGGQRGPDWEARCDTKWLGRRLGIDYGKRWRSVTGGKAYGWRSV